MDVSTFIQHITRLRNEVSFAEEKLLSAKLQLSELQKLCPHNTTYTLFPSGRRQYPHYVTVKARSDTGHWDRGSDRYWNDCHCAICNLSWKEDQ